MNRLLAGVCALFVLPVAAASWEFSAPLEVAPAQPGVFHQLDGSGRKHVAVSGDHVALVWEESRAGTAQVHAAFKSLTTRTFHVVRVSAGDSAGAPAIAALGGGRFVLAWEQDGAIWARVAEAAVLGPALRIAARAMQPALATLNGKIISVWSEAVDRQPRLRFAHLKVRKQTLQVNGTVRDVDPAPPRAGQLYPDVALTPAGITVAWEDRRRGHTILLHAFSRDGKRFSQPRVLNEQPAKRSEVFGKGSGAARVTLARHGARGVAAVWLDKRNFLEGYDVFAGFAPDGARFGKNQKVQDDFGNTVSQWHAALAADGAGRVAVMWDDDRDGTADLWLAWPAGGGRWSENLAVPGASGEGQQTSPAMVFDSAGNLHCLWVERATLEEPTQLRYAVGRFSK